jgi:FMN phosphatase YigB (HAD superfamily)
MQLKPTLLLDLDNTLIECGQYYLDARRDASRAISTTTGMTEKVAYDLIEAVDLASIAGPNGFSRDRYPTSFHIAALVASQIMNNGVQNYGLARTCYEIGNAVFTAEYAMYPGVRDALVALREMGFQLVITTKGDPEVQEYKITKHNLRSLVDKVYVSLTKTPAEQDARLTEVGADRENSWFIGDSRKDDIGPAVKLGVNSILVDPGTNSNWAYNKSDVEPTLHAPKFAEVPAIIADYPRLRAQRVIDVASALVG